MRVHSIISVILLGMMVIMGSACSKEGKMTESSDELRVVTFDVPGFSTIETRGENDVKYPVIAVYRKSGSKYNLVAWEAKPTATFKLDPKFDYYAYAFTGYSSAESYQEVNQLLDITMDFNYENNGSYGLSAIGDIHVDMNASGTQSIPMNRVVAKVVFTNVKMNFTRQDISSLKLVDCYLINAPKYGSFRAAMNNSSHTSSPSTFYNNGAYRGECNNLIYHSLGRMQIGNGQTKSTNSAVFYVFPNTNGSKKTKLILETEFGSDTYYYPVELPNLRSNYVYTIDCLTMTKLGISSPDGPWVPDENCSFNIVVDPWTDGGGIY